MNKALIEFYDVAPGALESSKINPDSYEVQKDYRLNSLDQLKSYATFESSGIDLTDDTKLLAADNSKIGYVSTIVSDRSGVFAGGLALIIDLNGIYKLKGLTVFFHEFRCTEFSVDYLKNNELMASSVSTPTDLNAYNEANGGEAVECDKVRITFLKTENPYQFVRISRLIFGKMHPISLIYGEIVVFEEISPDFSDLPASTCDCTVQMPEGITPRTGQELVVRFDGECFGRFLIEQVTEELADVYSLQGSDLIMQLDKTVFTAEDITFGGTFMTTIAEMISTESKVPIEIDGITDAVVGFIKKDATNRMAALMLSFASQSYVSAARSQQIRYFKARDRTDEIRIGRDEIYNKDTLTLAIPYTEMRIYEYTDPTQSKDQATAHTVSNPDEDASIMTNVKEYDGYTLMPFMHGMDEFVRNLADLGFAKNEISPMIELRDDIRVGDIITVETVKGKDFVGIVKSLDLSIGCNRIIATAVVAELGVNSNV